MRARSLRPTALLAALVMLLAACNGGDDDAGEPEPAATEAADTELAVAVASFDLHVGEDQRLIAGVLTADRGIVAFGDVEMEIAPADTGGDDAAAQTTTATFLPVPGAEPEGGGSQPTVVVGDSGAGVYETEVDLDQAGPWELTVTAELADGTTRQGTAAFQVAEEAEILTVGDEAPLTENLTVDDVDGDEVLPVMVDSRAQGRNDEIPAAHLHDTTIAEGIEAGRPVVALFATPIYCVSRFCGPITEVFGDIAEQYEDRADFVHVEVWKDFDAQELNEGAAEWIQTAQGGNEPWTFLIDEEGRIAARWDNVLDADDLIDHLEELPTTTHAEDD
jgi:hypothetical protein